MLKMCRISTDGIGWKEIWVDEQLINVVQKYYERKGYYFKKSIVKKRRG